LKAIGGVVLVALVCSYLTLCLLYRRGQWQIVLHPTHKNASAASSADIVRFGPDESAVPQLVGRWLQAAPGSRYGAITVLFLPSGDGSLADSDATLRELQTLGLNVFAFDYRGYGLSTATHPSEQKMIADTQSAWNYLTGLRGIPARQIIPYGVGVGASLAARLAADHPEIPALILVSPRTDLLEAARRDPRSSLIPAWLLFNQRFPLADPLSKLSTPKLLFSTTPDPHPPSFKTAADPKISVVLPSLSGPMYQQAITRLLDAYTTTSSAQPLMPTRAPSSTNSR